MKPLVIGQISTSETLMNPGGLERFVEGINRIRQINLSAQILPLGNYRLNFHWLIKSVLLFLRVLRNYRKISIIECHHILSGLITVLIVPKPVVVFYHSPWAEERLSSGNSNRISFFIRQNIEKAYLLRSDQIVTVGKSMRDYLIFNHGISESKIRVVGAGVNILKFNSSKKIKSNLSVFTARRLEPRMGLVDLILAWSILEPALRGSLRIAGTGSQFELLKKMIVDLQLTQTVILLGRVSEDELIKNYQEAKLTVIPTRALEGFGLVTLESLSCGTPVVSTQVGELKYLIGEQWPELTYESGQPAQLAEILKRISIGEIELPSETECRQYAGKFTWEKTSASIDLIYRSLNEDSMKSKNQNHE